VQFSNRSALRLAFDKTCPVVFLGIDLESFTVKLVRTTTLSDGYLSDSDQVA